MNDDTKENRNVAPYPTELASLVGELQYRPGWRFDLVDLDRGQESEGLTFIVLTRGYDTYHPDRGETYRVCHYFPVPAAAYNRPSWMRWLLDRLVEVETHEACEFFRLELHGEFVLPDGSRTDKHVRRPFAPNHGPGWDPYAIRELNAPRAAETSFRGERREGTQR